MTSILIVDDEPSVRETLAGWLRTREVAVSEAASAGEALDQMAEHPPAVALCDVGLPDRNGLWLAGQIRRQFPETALVLTTGYGPMSLPATLDADAIAYLPKPFTRQQLMHALDWALAWRQQRAC